MMKIALTLLAIIAVANAATLRGTVENTSEHAMLEKVKQSAFGSKLLTQLAEKLENSNSVAPIQTIIDLLNELQNDIAAEQAAADQLNQTEAAECRDNIQTFNNAIVYHTNAKAAADERISVADVNIDAATDGIAVKTEALRLNGELQQCAEDDRAAGAALFAERVDEHNAAMTGVDAILAEIRQSESYTGGQTFLQESSAKMTKMMHRSVRGMYRVGAPSLVAGGSGSAAYTPVAAEEYEITGGLTDTVSHRGANMERAATVEELLVNLKAALQTSKTKFEEDEDAAIAAHDANMTSLVAQQNQLQGDLDELNDLLTRWGAEKADAEAESQRQADLLDQAEADLAETEANCAAKGAQYVSETAERTEESEVVTTVIGIATDKLNTLSGTLQSRVDHVDAGENGEKNWENDFTEAENTHTGWETTTKEGQENAYQFAESTLDEDHKYYHPTE